MDGDLFAAKLTDVQLVNLRMIHQSFCLMRGAVEGDRVPRRVAYGDARFNGGLRVRGVCAPPGVWAALCRISGQTDNSRQGK